MVEVPGYEAPIPTVLEDIKRFMIQSNAFQKVRLPRSAPHVLSIRCLTCLAPQLGVFRVSPPVSELRALKQDLIEEKITRVEEKESTTLAALIGAWFRELPTPLLDAISPAAAARATTDAEAWALLQTVSVQERVLAAWYVCRSGARARRSLTTAGPRRLFDVCVAIAAHSSKNRMPLSVCNGLPRARREMHHSGQRAHAPVQNLAVVITPNLWLAKNLSLALSPEDYNSVRVGGAGRTGARLLTREHARLQVIQDAKAMTGAVLLAVSLALLCLTQHVRARSVRGAVHELSSAHGRHSRLRRRFFKLTAHCASRGRAAQSPGGPRVW